MKLYWSSRSPYVRKVMVAAHEVGLADRIVCEAVRVTAVEPHLALMEHNPLGKIPTLILDNGAVLYDSSVICAYVDTLHDGPRLFPAGDRERLVALQREALADGLIETLLIRLAEGMRQQPEQSAKRIANCRRKIANVLSRLEQEASSLQATPFGIGHIAIGSALAYMDFRFGDENWRADRPELAAWHATFAARPSAVATQFRDEYAI